MGFLEWLSLRVKLPDTQPATGSVSADDAAAAYFKLSALATAISYKANAIAMCTMRVYEGGEEVHNELWYRLNYDPNPNQSASQFWNAFMEHLCREGEALIVPIDGRFYVADSFAQQKNQLRDNVFTSVSVETYGYSRDFQARDCMYFRLNDKNISAYVEQTLGQYAQLMASAVSDYRNTSGQKYKVVLDRAPTGTRNDEGDTQAMLQANLKTFISNANAVYMETKGQHLEPVKIENRTEPSDITELRKEIYDSAAIAFKIPRSVMYGDMTNMGDLVDTMLMFAVDPEAQMLSDELTRKNYSMAEVCKGCKVKVDTTTIKHVGIFDVAQSAMNLVSSGVLTIDDVLEALGRERVCDEVTSSRMMTKNLGAIEDVLRQMAQEGGEK